MDSAAISRLVNTVLAARLMGTTTVLTGLSTELAQALATLDVDLSTMHIVGDLQGGVEEAERLVGALALNDHTDGPESRWPSY